MKRPAVLIFAVVAALLVIAWSGGWLAVFTDREAIQATIAQAGFWGPLLFIALALGMFAAFMLAPVVWASTAVWPLPLAFTYSFAASLLASVITYAAARRLGQDWAQDRVPASIQRWEERLRVHPFSTIIALRMLLWANPLIDVFAAVARVPTRTYLLASVVGLLPPTAFQILLGAGGITIAGHLPWWGWALAAGVALAGGFSFSKLRARRALK
jgi:uncharacterized membrane protein YdjX (TVP38/TMEM64 family)